MFSGPPASQEQENCICNSACIPGTPWLCQTDSCAHASDNVIPYWSIKRLKTRHPGRRWQQPVRDLGWGWGEYISEFSSPLRSLQQPSTSTFWPARAFSHIRGQPMHQHFIPHQIELIGCSAFYLLFDMQYINAQIWLIHSYHITRSRKHPPFSSLVS